MSSSTGEVVDLAFEAPAAPRTPQGENPYDAYIREAADGSHVLHLLVEGVHCGGCIAKIERALSAEPGVTQARLNFTTRRLVLAWRGEREEAARLVAALEALGYSAAPYDPDRLGEGERREERRLLLALAVAGFAAGNVMLLSVAVWAGYAEGMGEATRDLLHWFSALIALPAILYAGLPFYRSAVSALAKGRTNMDVPISLAVVLAGGMSLFEVIQGGEHAYFDSAVTLLFFLLIGRYLDHRARGKARSAAERLLAIRAESVTVVREDGSHVHVPAEQVLAGMTVLAAPGDRIAVDGVVASGASEVDASLITGESLPRQVASGDRVYAGTLNLGGALTLKVTAVGEDTLLGEIVRLMEAAEQRRARHVVLADRVARIYAPAVHGLALAAFLGWLFLGGLVWQDALMIAVAVLIVTCPCALGLAVPAVQVIASGRLMRQGILVKSGSALERLAEADTIVFDKTGTLTLGRPVLIAGGEDRAVLEGAASLAANSRHPLARALVAAVGHPVKAAQNVREEPGMGLVLATAEGEWRLGRRAFVGAEPHADEGAQGGPELWYRAPGDAPRRFLFEDRLRADAEAVIARLRAEGYRLQLLSGDRTAAVSEVAERLGIEAFEAEMTPAEKVQRLEAMAEEGRKVLMVGDGLNDAPALAAASVSVSPTSAADISQTAADALFQGERLAPVAELLTVARRARRLVTQNFGLAFAYNAIAVPLAIAGFVTPLIAAICMSASSLVVTGNALRLSRRRSAAA